THMALHRRRSTRAASTLAGLALVAAGLTPATAQPDAPSSDGDAGSLTAEHDPWSAGEAVPTSDWEGVASDTGLWIVRVAGPSVAAWTAAAQSGAGTASVGAAEDYDAQLESTHSRLVETIDDTLGRDVDVAFTYRNAL